MYNENDYENYMRAVLGYNNNQYEYSTNQYNNVYFPYRSNEYFDNSKYKKLYPEIYNMLEPMIKKACDTRLSDEITEELIEDITDEIYRNIEPEVDIVNINVTTTNTLNRSNSDNRSGNMKINQNNQPAIKDENSRACCGNPLLKDLIKILLLNQIINNRPPRPVNPGKPRPPMPPPGNPWPRPPYRSDYSGDYINPYFS